MPLPRLRLVRRKADGSPRRCGAQGAPSELPKASAAATAHRSNGAVPLPDVGGWRDQPCHRVLEAMTKEVDVSAELEKKLRAVLCPEGCGKDVPVMFMADPPDQHVTVLGYFPCKSDIDALDGLIDLVATERLKATVSERRQCIEDICERCRNDEDVHVSPTTGNYVHLVSHREGAPLDFAGAFTCEANEIWQRLARELKSPNPEVTP